MHLHIRRIAFKVSVLLTLELGLIPGGAEEKSQDVAVATTGPPTTNHSFG